MLVTFSIANFRSFGPEETFSLVASNRLGDTHTDHMCPIPGSDKRVLRAGVIYGANGSGKSNLFKALDFVQDAVVSPRKKDTGTGRDGFRLAGRPPEESSFDLQFIARQKLYRFGFKASDESITEEWLAEIVDGKESTIYERITTLEGRVEVEAVGLRKSSEKAATLASLGGPKNITFLATISSTLEEAEYGSQIRDVVDWFKGHLKLISPQSRFSNIGEFLVDYPEFGEFAGKFLHSVSTGVDSLKVTKTDFTEEQMKAMMSAPIEALDVLDGEDLGAFMFGEGTEIKHEKSAEKPFQLIKVASIHQSKNLEPVEFSLSEESDGTRRLLHLLPAIHELGSKSSVYFIDEIDRSLHPNLVWAFVEFFLKSCLSSTAQLIVTTHESKLLDLELLRRDEIWFMEKDQSGASRMYPLTDFKVRTDYMIRKHYLQGRFGAIPFLGDLSNLLQEEKQG